MIGDGLRMVSARIQNLRPLRDEREVGHSWEGEGGVDSIAAKLFPTRQFIRSKKAACRKDIGEAGLAAVAGKRKLVLRLRGFVAVLRGPCRFAAEVEEQVAQAYSCKDVQLGGSRPAERAKA